MRGLEFIFLLGFPTALLASPSGNPSYDELAKRYTKRTPNGVHLPIVRTTTKKRSLVKRDDTGSAEIGDQLDQAYQVLISVGSVTTPLIVDTGSSDTWVISDACNGCNPQNLPLYPQKSFKSAGLSIDLRYGDSFLPTQAVGLIGSDTVQLAGFSLPDQYFGSMNFTNTSVEDAGGAGIFGLGYASNSGIWMELFLDKYANGNSRRSADDENAESTGATSKSGALFSHFNNFHLPRGVADVSRLVGKSYYLPPFPDASRIKGLTQEPGSGGVEARQSGSVGDLIISSFKTLGPFIPRLLEESALKDPLFALTLQRATIDTVGDNAGLLSLGELPDGTSTDSLTWSPLRLYTEDMSGIPAPSSTPNEAYPITWDVMIDDVYFDGEKLPRSQLSPTTLALSALVDSGSSYILGPEDTVDEIFQRLGGQKFSCGTPHTLAFQINGKMFPVDPRDFIVATSTRSTSICGASLSATDPPKTASPGYRFSWVLGDPFLKSALTAFYFGNIAQPSLDLPRMGFLSTVPANADDLLKEAVAKGSFPLTTEQLSGGGSNGGSSGSGSSGSKGTKTTSGPGSSKTGGVSSDGVRGATFGSERWMWLASVVLSALLVFAQ